MKKILIFGGTTEGRELAQRLSNREDMQITACVATEYGAELLQESELNAKILAGRQTEGEMQSLIATKFDAVVDATHPYAAVASENIETAAKSCGVLYLRLLREASDSRGAIHVSSTAQAAEKLLDLSGNILLTTGSKELEKFIIVPNFAERIFPRVLPSVESVEKCEKLGFLRKNIIAMQGPFSTMLNIAIIEQFNIKNLVTKDGGKQGGFTEKIDAATQTGTQIIVINRPKIERGFNMQEILEILDGGRLL